MTDNATADTMKSYLFDLPGQFSYALQQSYDPVREYQGSYKNVIVSGLGGSAIGGDILKAYAAQKMEMPVIVNRDYHLPRFVNQDTLFVAVSYSGNTEETLQAYSEARSRGARIMVITSGGKLAEMAVKDGHVVVSIPGGLSPRAATGYLLAPLLLSLEAAGLFTCAAADLEETCRILQNLRDLIHPGMEGHDNPARLLAQQIKGNIPVIWGTAGCSEPAALRWKAQINENAKSPAYYNVFPELNHNEIVGFEAPAELLSSLVIIILIDKYDNERVQKRIAITREIIRDRVKHVLEVESAGESLLARIYSLIYVGDYASYYLALEYGINPTPVAVIDYLKQQLAGI